MMECFPWFGDKIAAATQERILEACETGSVGVVDLAQLKAFLSTADAHTVDAAFKAIRSALQGDSHSRILTQRENLISGTNLSAEIQSHRLQKSLLRLHSSSLRL